MTANELMPVIFTWKWELRQKTVSGTRATEKPKDKAMRSIASISFFSKNAKVHAKPGMNSTKIEPRIMRVRDNKSMLFYS